MAKIAVIGFGVVGSGTVELFYANKESICKKAGKDLDIKYILDLRDFPDSIYKDKLIKDFNIILNDDEIENCFDSSYYLRNIDEIYSRFGI